MSSTDHLSYLDRLLFIEAAEAEHTIKRAIGVVGNHMFARLSGVSVAMPDGVLFEQLRSYLKETSMNSIEQLYPGVYTYADFDGDIPVGSIELRRPNPESTLLILLFAFDDIDGAALAMVDSGLTEIRRSTGNLNWLYVKLPDEQTDIGIYLSPWSFVDIRMSETSQTRSFTKFLEPTQLDYIPNDITSIFNTMVRSNQYRLWWRDFCIELKQTPKEYYEANGCDEWLITAARNFMQSIS
ncbi:hypothetical protein H6798_04235 [Candidatus Nomurabacteria bacterium]|nr:hypothetical protein [Candidatus Nomurabacteria bacterium]